MHASQTVEKRKSLFDHDPLVIAALHLPDFNASRARSQAWFEDYVLANAEVFVKAGIPAIKLQDESRETGTASPTTIAQMAALGRLLKREFPDVLLGIIVQAHDAVAPLAVAHAAGADFVRLKVFTGQVITSEGPRDGLGVAAGVFRHSIRREDIALLGDVYDRTSVPRDDVSPERAAAWAVGLGADAVVITGADFNDTLGRIERLRSAGITRPVIVGGGVTAANIRAALTVSDGVIASRSVMLDGVSDDDLVRWDVDAGRRLMDEARLAARRE